MNNFFKQLLGSLVQIGISELGRAKDQRNKDQRPNKEICSNKKLAREVSIAFRQDDDEGADEIDLSGHRGRERGSQHSIKRQ